MSNSHDIYLSDASVAFYTEQILSGNIQSIIPEVDSFIKEYYKNIHGRLNGSRLRKAFLNARPFLKLYFNNRYFDSLSYRETVFRIMNDIEIRPVCKTCRGRVGPVAFDTDKFNDFCCNRCAQSNKDIIEKKKQTTLKNFGVEWGTQCEEVQAKRKATCIEIFGVDNAMRSDTVKKGMRERHRAKYGCDYSFQRKEVIKKSEETCLRKYGVRHANELKEFQEKAEETCLKNYGVKYPMQSEKIKKKSVETSLRKYGVTNPNKIQETKEKISNTCLEKYGSKSYLQSEDYKTYMVEYNERLLEERGVNNCSQLPEVIEKRHKTMLEKYGVLSIVSLDERREEIINKIKATKENKTEKEKDQIINKTRQTCLEKYGCDWPSKRDDFRNNLSKIAKARTLEEKRIIQEKRKKTLLEKYGYDSPTKDKDIINKIFETKRKNNTITYSSKEKILKFILEVNFKNIKEQYHSNEYPFHADFYIEEYDLYIEYQGTWTHGLHAFDENNNDDINRSIFLLDKSKDSKYYNIAYDVWTKRDPLKRQTAKDNSLRYLEIFPNFPLEEIPDLIQKEFSNLSEIKQIIVGEK